MVESDGNVTRLPMPDLRPEVRRSMLSQRQFANGNLINSLRRRRRMLLAEIKQIDSVVGSLVSEQRFIVEQLDSDDPQITPTMIEMIRWLQ